MSTPSMDASSSKPFTFLFTDLENSTQLWEEFPEGMKTALERHDTLLKTIVEGANGQIVKTTGDGLHAAFSSTQECIVACLTAQQRLLKETWEETGPLRVRMGLHVGEAQPRGGDYYGSAVNRAARLMSAAHGGQVLVSAAAAQRVEGRLPEGASLRDLGEHRLKDLQRPEHIYELFHPELLAGFPPISTLNIFQNNLPTQPSAFIGRAVELKEINDRLAADDIRLLTLTGPGGTGKTRLALQTGAELIDRFADGVFFIDLAPIRDPNDVFTAIARTIGLSESSDRPIFEDLKDQLRDKIIFLLLDNFEQVTAAAAQVAELLQFCPRLKLLTTSREALRVRGEHLYPIPPLGVPNGNLKRPTFDQIAQYEAVQLFVERAQAVKPGFALTKENAEAVAEVCKRLDGLPLALELAAARIRLFSPQALSQRLGSRLKLLRGGARDLPERQQTLRDTIDWSYELLAPGEQKLFEIASVFSSFTFEAVEALVGAIEEAEFAEVDIYEGLESLVDKSLIRLQDDGLNEPRLSMLETIREFAKEQLDKDGALNDRVCREHALYYANFTQNRWPKLIGLGREEALDEIVADVENIRIAWNYWIEESSLEQLNKMVDSLWLVFEARGWYLAMIEISSDLLNTLEAAPSTPELARQEIMLQTSLARALLAIKGYTPEVEAAYQKALDLCEKYGQIPQLFPVLRGLSSYYTYIADFDRGAEIGQKILELAESRDDDSMRIHGYLVYGSNYGFGNLRHGIETLEKGIAIFDPERISTGRFRLGNNPGIVCHTTSAFFLQMMGFPERARERTDRGLALAIQINHPFTMAYAYFHTGVLHLFLGEMETVRKRADRLLEIAEEHEFQVWEVLGTILYGVTQAAMGQPEQGLAKVNRSIELYHGLNNPPVFWPSVVALQARAYLMAGKPDEGLRVLDDALGLSGPIGTDERILPEFLLLRGDLLQAISPEDLTEARNQFRQALAISQGMEANWPALIAATRLCQMDLREGQGKEFGRLLREIYDTFTEGFDFPDLIQAKKKLEELKG